MLRQAGNLPGLKQAIAKQVVAGKRARLEAKENKAVAKVTKQKAKEASKREAVRQSPAYRAKELKNMRGKPELTGLVRLMQARNGSRPGKTFDGIWVYRTQASREHDRSSGFAVDHTGLVFVFGKHRLTPSPRLLRLIKVPVEDIKKGVSKVLDDVSKDGEPSLTSIKRLPFGGQSAMLRHFETVTKGPMYRTESFRSLERHAWVSPIVLARPGATAATATKGATLVQP